MNLVSACLVGIKCNYKGTCKLNEKVYAEFQKGNYYPVCPEVLGGLPIPRHPSEIVGKASDVLCGNAYVKDTNGQYVTRFFRKGAIRVLEIADSLDAREAILKSNSPSCGCGKVFDGTFSGTLIDGDGVTTALLKQNGIRVITEKEL
jgi:uncharacterized protein YbbK (DUF523 family)